MELICLRESTLDPSINVLNFKERGILLTEINWDLVRSAHGVQKDFDNDPFRKFTESMIIGVPISDYVEFSRGHYVDKVFLNKVKDVVQGYGMQEHCHTFCAIMLVQQCYMRCLENDFPVYEKPELLQIQDMYNEFSLGSKRTSKRHLKTKQILSEAAYRMLNEEIIRSYLLSDAGKTALSAAHSTDKIDQVFFERLGDLKPQLANQGNTLKRLKTALIQRLFLMLGNKIKIRNRKCDLIGRLLVLIDAHHPFDPNIYEDFQFEYEYHYHVLKNAVLKNPKK